MLRGLQIARTGLLAEQVRSELAGHNLANLATEGYQRRTLATGSFDQLVLERIGQDAPGGPPVGTLGAGPAALAQAADERFPVPGGSNVDPAQEMAALMVAVRTFEAIQRSVLAQDEAARKAANEIGRL